MRTIGNPADRRKAEDADHAPAHKGRDTMKPTVWKNPNGTWSHHRDASCEWPDEASCRTDLRFTEEWLR